MKLMQKYHDSQWARLAKAKKKVRSFNKIIREGGFVVDGRWVTSAPDFWVGMKSSYEHDIKMCARQLKGI